MINDSNGRNIWPFLRKNKFPTNLLTEFGVLHSLKCKVGRSPLDPSDQHQFHKNGSITVGSSKYEPHEFCIENALFSPDYIEVNEVLHITYYWCCFIDSFLMDNLCLNYFHSISDDNIPLSGIWKTKFG